MEGFALFLSLVEMFVHAPGVVSVETRMTVMYLCQHTFDLGLCWSSVTFSLTRSQTGKGQEFPM